VITSAGSTLWLLGHDLRLAGRDMRAAGKSRSRVVATVLLSTRGCTTNTAKACW
jgi:hypothetical protein